jgi:hypothetical protein
MHRARERPADEPINAKLIEMSADIQRDHDRIV